MTTPNLAVDFTTGIGKLRALIPDVERVPNPNAPTDTADYIFNDNHLEAFLDLNSDNTYLAAADACEALGTSEGYIAKVIKTEDLQTDGAKLMGQFLLRAKQLRRRAASDIFDEAQNGFDIIPYVIPKPNRAYWIGG